MGIPEDEPRNSKGCFILVAIYSCIGIIIFILGRPVIHEAKKAYRPRNLALITSEMKKQYPYVNCEGYIPVVLLYHTIRSGNTEQKEKAALLCSHAAEIGAFPYLIENLNDESPFVRKAVLRALQELSGKDYDPDPAKWRTWWKWPDRYTTFLGHGPWPIAIGFKVLILMLVGTSVVFWLIHLIRVCRKKKVKTVDFVQGSFPLFAAFWFYSAGFQGETIAPKTLIIRDQLIHYMQMVGHIRLCSSNEYTWGWIRTLVLFGGFVVYALAILIINWRRKSERTKTR